MPYYGSGGKGRETVAEWLLGDRKWRLLSTLAENPGRSFRADDLATEAGCASPTTYEFLRALKPTEAIREHEAAYALDAKNDLAEALIALACALRARPEPVDRPTRSRRRDT